MKLISLVITMAFFLGAQAQSDLPLQYTDNGDTSKPLILYISGDGGMNSFTTSLINSLNQKGYAVLALDAKSYFWHKKEPAEFATAMTQAVSSYLRNKKKNSFVVLGYSFGADVAPFLATRLPSYLATKCKGVLLLSPSGHTDFEIKIVDMLGWGSKKENNVVTELNKVALPATLFFGQDEKEFPVNDVTIRKQVVVMSGGHHYGNDTTDLANEISHKIR
ncbi:MAG: AcvB/VirJ family lysyl-phosphatidylglycerol hydrolase [Flavisolibacter sp.]